MIATLVAVFLIHLANPYVGYTDWTTTTLRVVPQTVELGPGGVLGQEFTIAVAFENVNNLSGVDVEFAWNPTYLSYVNHTVTIPVEDYPSPQAPSPYGGILHAPELFLVDDVNAAFGTYQVAFATLGGLGFTGNGTIFVMRLRVENQSYLDIETDLNIYWYDPDPGIPENRPTIVDGVVQIPGFTSDIAVTGMDVSKTVVGLGYTAYVNVTVENQGGYPETFNITLLANASSCAMVESIVVDSLSSITIPVLWNTSEWMRGNYTMGFYATLLNDTDTMDNSFTGGWIFVTIPGDVDGDRDVDIFDVTRFAACYCLDWVPDPNTDIDGNGVVDIYDVVILCGNYGESW